MRQVDAYLSIPDNAAQACGGLAWLGDGKAIERADGTTYTVVEEVLSFLEGFALVRPLIEFGYLLLALGLVKGRWGPPAGADVAVDRLRAAFKVGGRVRNAGAFFADLLALWPRAPDAPCIEEICRRVLSASTPPFAVAVRTTPAPALSIASDRFLREIQRRLADYDSDALESWMRHAVAPRRLAGAQLAEMLQTRPAQSLESLLGDLVERPRLVGARSMVERLGAALTLPPRKLVDPGLPIGGYSDVTTYGQPERLLLSQFALDEIELMRRLAEGELLYYRREEPRAEIREELIIVLDQGVRTWGTPRLVLLAALLTLGRVAAHRNQVIRLATTGQSGGPWNPEEISREELASRLESSDLSQHPGLVLESVLETPVSGPRDVVLLTHPRGLEDPDVQAAACRSGSSDLVRLFALTADREGHAELSEFHQGRAVATRSFRVEMQPTRRERRSRPGEGLQRWTGEIEPLPGLFCINPGPGQPTLLAFDLLERHLLLVLAEGALMLVPLDGQAELLPRYCDGKEILKTVQWVRAVPGGFLVCGVSRSGGPLLARYDLEARHVEARPLAEANPGAIPGELCLVAEDRSGDDWLAFDSETGRIDLCSGGRTAEMQPLLDGRATLRNMHIHRARCCGGVLALVLSSMHRETISSRQDLHVYKVTSGQLLFAVRLDLDTSGWAISPRGTYAAFELTQPGQFGIRTLALHTYRPQPTPRHHRLPVLSFHLGEGWLVLATEYHRSLLVWSGDELALVSGRLVATPLDAWMHSELAAFQVECRPTTRTIDLDLFPADPNRFRLVKQARLLAGIDQQNILMLFDRLGTLIAQVVTRDGKIALATPDGQRYGDPDLMGQPPTVDAGVVLASRLRTAERLGPENWS